MHEIIVAMNRLKDQVKDLTTKVDFLSKSPSQQLTKKYLDVEDVCAILHVSDRTLYKMRSAGELPFVRIGRKILYQASDIHQYIESKLRRRAELFNNQYGRNDLLTNDTTNI